MHFQKISLKSVYWKYFEKHRFWNTTQRNKYPLRVLLSFCVFTVFIGAPSLESVIFRMLLLYLNLCCIKFVFFSLSFSSTHSQSIISKGIFLSWGHCFMFHHFTFSLCFVSLQILWLPTCALCQSLPFFSSLVYTLEFRSILSLLSVQLLHLSSWCCFMFK